MLDLTIQVLDLSPEVTIEDLNIFFSYCGTIEKIWLQRNEDESQLAFVTFRQPYAAQTALLLDDAIIVDHPIRILPSTFIMISPISEKINTQTQNNEKLGLIPAAQSAVRAIALKGSRAVDQQTRQVIKAAEQTVGHAGSVIVNNELFSAGALWLSGVLDNASKYTAELGNNSKKRNPNSRKQK